MFSERSRDGYRIIYTETGEEKNVFCGKYEDRKSVFIASMKRVGREQEVLEFISELRKQYPEACSHAYAYVIGESGELFRCNDNGEPNGTAGKPILEVLIRSGIRNVVAVVSRYYGGTKLGTGGLIRAYTNAVQAALANCPIAVMRYGKQLQIQADYNDIGKILYYMNCRGIEQMQSDYAVKVKVTVVLPNEEADLFCRDIVDLTAGRAQIMVLSELLYPVPEN